MTIESRMQSSSDPSQGIDDVLQFVTFVVADEIYGVSVHVVQSINEMVQITRLPNSDSFIEGVINLRGNVVPVINIRKKYNLPHKEYDLFTVIIIVEIRDRLVGLIVDSVSDVISLPASSIQKDIRFASAVDTGAIQGIGNLNDQLIILLNIENFVDNEKELDECYT